MSDSLLKGAPTMSSATAISVTTRPSTHRKRVTRYDTIYQTGHRCFQTGKHGFGTERQAHEALIATRRARTFTESLGLESSRAESRFYECEFCGLWHLTSRPEGASNRRVG